MKNILTMSRREITRLRARFSGKSRFIVLAVLALTIIGSFVIYHQDLVISKGLYNVGVSAGAPLITDSRFNITELDRDTGYEMLEQGTVDLYLDGSSIFSNYTERSEYAAGALQKYLEKQEILRVAGEYEIDRAFPLRIEVSYLDTEDEGLIEESVASVPDAGEIPEYLTTVEDETPAVPVPSEPVAPLPALDEKIAAATAAALPESLPAAPSASDEAIRQQLADFAENNQLPEFKAEFVAENDIIIPSLMNPPIPLAQVIITFLYVVPVFFISLFFTSSFTEEKVSRKLIVLLSAPVTRFQVIMGKMLPYLAYSIIVIIGVTMVLQGNILLGLAIFVPVMLFIFSIYLMVALTYRTFKDQTFFSVLALSVVTVYLVGPAMFTGVNDLSYISPLTLAVTMYRGETFTASQYFLATTPLLLVFGQSMYVGTRVFNEEYLMGFRPLHSKIAEAIYLTLDRAHLSLSTLFMGMSLVPLVFMVELASIVFVTNLPLPFMLGFMLIVSVVVEELAKSAGVVILLQNKALARKRDVLKLAALSALGFMLAEKLLLLMAMSVVSDSPVIEMMFGGGMLLLPLALHVVSTSVVCLFTARFGTRYYLPAIVLGSIIHAIYNVSVMGALL
ncbi:MAG: ABC transporter permease subunit [Dehalococcoidales bacterium]|nr:ABC transporter permease subunit [Dehalococcoidales bacterium]